MSQSVRTDSSLYQNFKTFMQLALLKFQAGCCFHFPFPFPFLSFFTFFTFFPWFCSCESSIREKHHEVHILQLQDSMRLVWRSWNLETRSVVPDTELTDICKRKDMVSLVRGISRGTLYFQQNWHEALLNSPQWVSRWACMRESAGNFKRERRSKSIKDVVMQLL